MSLAFNEPLTIEAFLAWEERQELRHEFDGQRIIAMTGGTSAHSGIMMQLHRTLGNQLAGKPCRPHGSELRLMLENSIRYPDAFVVCAPVAPTATFVTEPVVIFEIVSKSTVNDDLGLKRLQYQSTPSVQRYVVLQQTHRAAQVFYRTNEGWEAEFVIGAAVMDMPEIGCAIPLAEIYEGVTLVSDLG